MTTGAPHSLDQVLHEQGRSIERTTAALRSLIWLGVGLAMIVAVHQLIAAGFCFLAAAQAAVFRLWILRYRYARWMGLVATAVDLTALGFSIDAAYATFPPLDPLGIHMLYGGMLVGSFSILSINSLRGSSQVAVGGAIYAGVVYLIVVGRHGRLDGGSIIDVF